MATKVNGKSTKTNAMHLAIDFANAIEDRYSFANPRVRNMAEANEHGFTHNALATVCYEGLGEEMISMTMEKKWIDIAAKYGCYFEPYSSWLIAIYAC